MTIWGIGATYGAQKRDVSQQFIKHGCACSNYNENMYPSIFQILSKIKVGDLIYIKKFAVTMPMIIRALGVVHDPRLYDFGKLGKGVKVHWLWSGSEELTFADKYNVHRITVYEEFAPEVQNWVMNKLLSLKK